MGSCDFLRFYQQWTTPTKIVKENENSALDVTNGSVSGSNVPDKNSNSEAGPVSGDEASASSDCELSRRHKMLSQSGPANSLRGAGYFDKKWRSQLCRCSTCKVRER
jgi:hypothetical protein